jgi:formylglycine-generating enzyme required for sulfatase activity
MNPTDLETQLQGLRRTLEETRRQLASNPALTPDMVEAMLAPLRQQIAGVEVEIAAVPGDVMTGAKTTAIDQREQQVDVQINVAHLYQVYQAAPGRAGLTESEFGRVLADYLGWVVREYGYTRLHGLQSLQRTGALDRPLGQVYTSLGVRHRPAVTPGGDAARVRRGGRPDVDEGGEPAVPQPVDMANLLTLGERIAIVGGAGSGKTTYLSFVAASLASALSGQPLDVRLKPPTPYRPGTGSAPLPVPLLAPLRFWKVYRDECAQVPGLRVTYGPDQGSLGAFLLWFLRARYKNFNAAGDFFDRLLRGGQGCLILLDGLDEVVSVAERRVVRDEVERLLRSQYPGNRCLVTAREAGYRDAPFGSDFIRCDVQLMSEEQIATLVSAWCSQIYPQPHDCQVAGDDLLTAINRLNAERTVRGQEPLVASPLMVTMVVSVKYSRRELPRERAKLYDACVDVILSSEYTGREDDAGARQKVVYAGGPPDKQREWLSRLAFQMQLGGQAGASLDEGGVRAILEPVFRERGEGALLDSFLAVVRQRGGLLEERGERFQFMHLTFQEYLAAQFLARQWPEQPPGFLAEVVTDEWWREALLLTIGSLGAPVPYERRRAFIVALCDLEDSMPARLAAAELAATGLGDLTDPEPTLRAAARARLSALLCDPALVQVKPAIRALAGNALAVLGDERDFEELVTVPAGPFLMGDDRDSDARPQREVRLATFKIGVYPVTNVQYLRFVEATDRAWRSDKGRRPEQANHPAVYVSWHDARAYCAWLTEVWQAEGVIAADEVVRLPSEAEWEKAARGSLPSPSEGEGPGERVEIRIYPWGNKWDETKCNTSELGLGGTTPVGIFPEGASPYGCLDMAGNVWEWTISLWGNDPDKPEFRYPYDPTDGREKLEAGDKVLRVLRGGSWDVDRDFARCAFRYGFSPYSQWSLIGFRIVVSPFSPPSGL